MCVCVCARDTDRGRDKLNYLHVPSNRLNIGTHVTSPSRLLLPSLFTAVTLAFFSLECFFNLLHSQHIVFLLIFLASVGFVCVIWYTHVCVCVCVLKGQCEMAGLSENEKVTANGRETVETP